MNAKTSSIYKIYSKMSGTSFSLIATVNEASYHYRENSCGKIIYQVRTYLSGVGEVAGPEKLACE